MLNAVCLTFLWASQAYQCRSHRKCGFDPWVKKIPWRRKWQVTPVFLLKKIAWKEEPGELQSKRSLADVLIFGNLFSFSQSHKWPFPRRNLLNKFMGQYMWNLVWGSLALITEVSFVSLILMICVYILLVLLHNFCPPVSKTSKHWFWLKRTTANQSHVICTVNVWIPSIPCLDSFMPSVVKFSWPCDNMLV